MAKAAKQSAGILLYTTRNGVLHFFLVHPGGPFWKNKDDGAWSIPKGEFADEEPESAARREFREETGFEPVAQLIPLTPVRQKSGKMIHAFAAEQEVDPGQIRSNLFELEWPPRSGRMSLFPEIDKAGWFTFAEAARKIIPAQVGLLQQVVQWAEKKPAPDKN